MDSQLPVGSVQFPSHHHRCGNSNALMSEKLLSLNPTNGNLKLGYGATKQSCENIIDTEQQQQQSCFIANRKKYDDNYNFPASDKWTRGLRSDSPNYMSGSMISPPLTGTQVGRASTANELNCGGGGGVGDTISTGALNHSMAFLGAISEKGASNNKKGENCMTHAMPNTLWCIKCQTLICRACAGSDGHRNHTVKTQAKEAIRTEIAAELVAMQRSLIDVQHLALKQRDFLLKMLEACSSVKTQVENELVNHMPTAEVAEFRENFCRLKLCLNILGDDTRSPLGESNGTGLQCGSSATPPNSAGRTTPIELYKLYKALTIEKQRIHRKHQDLYYQNSFDDLLRSSEQILDIETLSRNIHAMPVGNTSSQVNTNALFLMANYCLTQIYARQSSKAGGPQKSSVDISNLPVGGTLCGSGNPGPDHFPFPSKTPTQSPAAINMSQFVLDLADGNNLLQLGSPSMHNLHNSLHYSTSHNPAISQQKVNDHSGQLLSSGSSLGHVIANPTGLGAVNTTGGGGGIGAGGISFEMNGISVPITVLSSPKLPSSAIQGGATATTVHHHVNPHLHHNNPHHQLQAQHHLLHSLNGSSSSSSNSSGSNSIICNPTVHIYPIYFFNIEINGQPYGRILIEVRNDVAPRMAKNFGALASGELGFGYKGCQIFQCWESESIITGDFELNNGRGGRSVFEEGFFMPDDTKILAIRGSVGMRRSQKRHDNMGLVGSQFRIILREMRGFTGIFAFVIEGLELVEKISQTGDSAGKPQSNVLIVSCGKLY